MKKKRVGPQRRRVSAHNKEKLDTVFQSKNTSILNVISTFWDIYIDQEKVENL